MGTGKVVEVILAGSSKCSAGAPTCQLIYQRRSWIRLRKMGGDGQVNYVHEEALWKQRLETEMKGAHEWFDNWGFLANKPLGDPRGFSSSVAKYTYGGSKWTVKQIRVSDGSIEGLSAAESEQKSRRMLKTLAWDTKIAHLAKPCEAQGAYTGMPLVVSDTSGVKGRDEALLMRTHKFHTLGNTCRTAGLAPTQKYRAPVVDSHEYGWRAPSTCQKGSEVSKLERALKENNGIKNHLARFN